MISELRKSLTTLGKEDKVMNSKELREVIESALYKESEATKEYEFVRMLKLYMDDTEAFFEAVKELEESVEA